MLIRFCWALMLALTATPAFAGHPFRGSAKWSIILCTFSDSPPTTRDAGFFRNMMVNAATGGVADYWGTLSRSGVNMNGSAVAGWYRQSRTVAQAQARGRIDRYNDCKDAARTAATGSYTPPADHLVAVVTSPGIDLFGMPGVGAFLPDDVDLGGFGHEGGHGLGLNHSFSDDPTYQNASWSQIGEYDDPWDVMSYANCFGIATTSFGFGGPGLNGYHLDRMGWLPRNEIRTFGAGGETSQSITLSSLYGGTGGTRLVRVPFDPGDLFRYYTVEFRQKTGWDNGIPASIVLIHETRKDASNAYFSYLLRQRTGNRDPVQSLNANGVMINVTSTAAGTATVQVTSDFTNRCLVGFVWREANAADRVCVTPQVRTETRNDNAQAANRRQPGGGPFGPDTCRAGFVWREAFPNDHVCVPPTTRTRSGEENRAAAERRNPARFVFGPNTCKSGFVWRDADGMDFVCVAGATRTETGNENSLAASRRQPGGGPFGPNTCRPGFVWREAFPNDFVCVPPASRTRARTDNADAANRVLRP